MALDPVGPKHHSERQAEIQEHRTLLDVQFEIGAGGPQLGPGFLHPLELDPNLPEGIRQKNAVLILEPPGLLEIERAGTGRRAEEAFAETRPLLVRPVDQPHGHWGALGVFGRKAPQDFQAGQDVEAAVEPAAVGHRIDMASDHEGPVRLSRQGAPKIPRGIPMDLDRESRQLAFEPLPRRGPGRGESHPLGPVGVGGELPQLLQFGDGAGGIDEYSGHRSLLSASVMTFKAQAAKRPPLFSRTDLPVRHARRNQSRVSLPPRIRIRLS